MAAGVVQATSSSLSDSFIYASVDYAGSKYIYRWEIGVSTSWTKIYSTAITTNWDCYGISLYEGVLYALFADGDDSIVYRTLAPQISPTVYWSTMTLEDYDLNTTPQALKVSTSDGVYKLWAINTQTTDSLYSYSDPLAVTAPVLTGPKNDAMIPINQIHGYASDVMCNWQKPATNVTGYNLWIALDADFNEIVQRVNVAESGSDVSQMVGPGASTALSFLPDTTYFWKVRVGEDSVGDYGPIKSQFSEARRFTIGSADVQPPVEIVIPPTPEITVTVPPPTEVVIPAPPAAPVAPAPIVPAYIWAVIIIGALLVIAVIVLIVRTRRIA